MKYNKEKILKKRNYHYYHYFLKHHFKPAFNVGLLALN